MTRGVIVLMLEVRSVRLCVAVVKASDKSHVMLDHDLLHIAKLHRVYILTRVYSVNQFHASRRAAYDL